MSDEEEIGAEEVEQPVEEEAEPEPEPEPEAEPEPEPEPTRLAPAKSPAPTAPSPTPVPLASRSARGSVASSAGDRNKPMYITKKSKDPVYSAGKPSRFDLAKLMASDGIVPLQSGSNKWDSQKGMTGFGMPRDTAREQKTFSPNIKEVTDEIRSVCCAHNSANSPEPTNSPASVA
jgi:hypothetical protein